MLSASKSGQYGGYQISRSVRVRGSASGYFTRTLSVASTSSTIFTWSGWVKRGSLAASRMTIAYHGNTGATGGLINLEFNSDATLRCFFDGTNTIQTTAVYRDPSAWYHIMLAYDSTQATASNRAKLYVNGVQITAFSTANYPPLNQAINAGVGNVQNLGLVSTSQFDGYLTELNFIDGQALTPSSFGVTNSYGVWSPIKYNGTYGNNGFYLNFSDNSGATATTIGKDSSGNGNNFTPNGIVVSPTTSTSYDSMLDVPTPWGDGGNGRGNYPTLNNVDGGIARTTISNSNLSTLFTGTAAGAGIRSSGFQMPTSGKWYAEFTLVAKPTLANASTVGISRADTILNSTSNWYIGTAANDFAWGWGTGFSNKTNNNSGTAYGTAPAVGNVIGVAVDLDTNPGAFTLTFYNNGVSQGAAWTNQSTGGQTFSFGCSGTDSTNFSANFGQRPFSYTPPTGFNALNTFNLPEPAIDNGREYMAATTYTGTGASLSVDNTVNNVSFQPDFVWVKGRSGATDHALYDSVRGVQLQLESNTTTAETTETTGLTAFNSNGFTVGALAQMNTNTATYVGWQWQEGAKQGFDIVTYTGNGANRTIAHNLGVAPNMMIVKNRNGTFTWRVYHSSLANTQVLFLSGTDAATTEATAWNSTSPTPTVFSVGTSSGTNGNGSTYVAYLFAEITGFSRFSSYTGNGSADGPFVFCGFRPRFVMIKRTNDISNWNIFDTARNLANVNNNVLFANLSNAESQINVDVLSNGFKLRDAGGAATNANGSTYIFAAFAENPFKYSLAR